MTDSRRGILQRQGCCVTIRHKFVCKVEPEEEEQEEMRQVQSVLVFLLDDALKNKLVRRHPFSFSYHRLRNIRVNISFIERSAAYSASSPSTHAHFLE